MKVANLLTRLQTHKDDFLGAKKGKEFEDRIQTCLDDLMYNRLLRDNIEHQWDYIKQNRNSKWSTSPILNNTKYHHYYIYQPGGSQEYPDFLILDKKHMLSIEVKFSSKSQAKPVWNSGLPRPTGIYIIASYGLKDITFFLGKDIVTPYEAQKLHEFFDFGFKDYRQSFNKYEMRQQAYGFNAYVRKAYDQNKQYNARAITDFYNNPDREKLEQSAIRYIKSL